MDNRELQKLAQQFGSVVILQDDAPAFVIISFEKYQQMGAELSDVLDNHAPYPQTEFDESQGSDIIDSLNKEILRLKEEIRVKEEEQMAVRGEESEVKER